VHEGARTLSFIYNSNTAIANLNLQILFDLLQCFLGSVLIVISILSSAVIYLLNIHVPSFSSDS